MCPFRCDLPECARHVQGVRDFPAVTGDGSALAERVRAVEALRAVGRRADAAAAMECCVSDSTRLFGPTHETTLALRADLASLWVEDVPDAERLVAASELVADCERVLEAQSPTTIAARGHLASLMALNGRYEDSLVLAEAAIADATRVLGPDDARTLGARKNRAATLFAAGKLTDATEELHAVIADMGKAPGVSAASVLSARRLLALTFRAAGMQREAREVLGPLAADCERALGADATLTKEVQALLAEARVYRGPYVAGTGTVPRPWVFVADGRLSAAERFCPPRPLSHARLPCVGEPPAPNAGAAGEEIGDRPPSGSDGETGVSEAESPATNRDAPSAGEVPVRRGVTVRVIGPVEITGWTKPKTRGPQLAEILCYLVFHRDRPVRAAALGLALRPDLDDEITEETLRAYLSHLRRAVGPDLLPHATKDGYLVSEEVSSDWERFSALSGPESDAARLEEALGLVRGRPFADVAAGTFRWVDAELVVSSIETAVADAARRLAGMVKTSDAERAGWAVRQGLLCSPYDFELWRLHVELAAGRGAVAVARARKEAEAVLGDEARSPLQ